jgi:hypothetical protein
VHGAFGSHLSTARRDFFFIRQYADCLRRAFVGSQSDLVAPSNEFLDLVKEEEKKNKEKERFDFALFRLHYQ